MQKVTLHFIFDASYDMMVNCNLIRQINKRHLVRSKFFLPCKKSHSIFFDKTGYVSRLYDIAS